VLKVLTQEGMIAERIKNQYTREVVIFNGKAEDNIKMKQADIREDSEVLITMATPKWEDSEGYVDLWKRIRNLRNKISLAGGVQNTATTPDLATLIQYYFIDINRRVMEQIDFTGMLTTEMVDYNFPESITLRDILPYKAAFGPINGVDDSLPLVQQDTGAVESVIIELFGVGWKQTLHNLLFNSLFEIQKVLAAVAEAYVWKRNDLCVGKIISTTYHASQKVPDAADPDDSYDENLYATFRGGYKGLKGLKDPRNTNNYITTNRIVGLCHSTRRWEIERVINGALASTGAGQGKGKIYTPLPINELWEYDGKEITVGKDKIKFSGCPTNKAFLFVPKDRFFTMVKRPITMEVGGGSALALTQQERGWYMGQINWSKDFFGSSAVGAATTGEGYIVVIDLPGDEYDT